MKFQVGGAICVRSACTQATASRALAAPSPWPVIALIELIGGPLGPKTVRAAATSARSFAGVPVPWAER